MRGDLTSAQDSLRNLADWRELAALLAIAIDHAPPSAVRRYVREWQTAVRKLLDAAGLPSDSRWETLLTDASLDAPLSPWLSLYGPVEGLGLTLLAQLRANVPGAQPLPSFRAESKLLLFDYDSASPPERTVFLVTPGPRTMAADAVHSSTSDRPVDLIPFRRVTLRILAELDEPTDLVRIQSIFDTSKIELAGLFGVSRQAISHWLASGRVPAERAEKVAAVAALADLLAHHLRAERIPGVVRRPADAYDGLTMLDLIRADRHRELLEGTRASFDWSVAA